MSDRLRLELERQADEESLVSEVDALLLEAMECRSTRSSFATDFELDYASDADYGAYLRDRQGTLSSVLEEAAEFRRGLPDYIFVSEPLERPMAEPVVQSYFTVRPQPPVPCLPPHSAAKLDGVRGVKRGGTNHKNGTRRATDVPPHAEVECQVPGL